MLLNYIQLSSCPKRSLRGIKVLFKFLCGKIAIEKRKGISTVMPLLSFYIEGNDV